MELDSIMMWVANEESFYNQIMRLYDKWVDDGDAWHEPYARKQADQAIREIAEAIQINQANYSDNQRYTEKEIREAIDEVLEDFEQYRDDELAARQQKASAKPVTRKPMDAGYVAYTKKMDDLLVKIGVSLLPDIIDHPVNMTEEDARKAAVDYFIRFMPASKEKIRKALETGDEHLNTIKLIKWDDKVEEFGGRRFLSKRHMSLADGVGILKHIAKWHYA